MEIEVIRTKSKEENNRLKSGFIYFLRENSNNFPIEGYYILDSRGYFINLKSGNLYSNTSYAYYSDFEGTLVEVKSKIIIEHEC